MTVLFLATVAFGLTFHLQMPSGAAVDKNLVAQSLWDSMLMATLGDNGGLAVQVITGIRPYARYHTTSDRA